MGKAVSYIINMAIGVILGFLLLTLYKTYVAHDTQEQETQSEKRFFENQERREKAIDQAMEPVSYTHLTLPTIYSV